MGDAIASLLSDRARRMRFADGARAAAARLSPEAHFSRLEAVLDRARR
jgi:glycosyltransferase involved in cell wall biosynthesis